MGKLPFSNRLSKAEDGLTIIETMVSITVFTFLIVLCIGLFIFLGRIYYRGLYENRVQEVARTIVDSVAESVRTSGAEIDPYNTATGEIVMIAGTPYTHTWYAYCIGNIQYSYKLNTQLVAEPDGSHEANEVFVAVRGCNNPDANPKNVMVDDGMGVLVPADKTELLSEGMRLLEFSIKQVGENQDFYRIRIKVAVGGDASDLPYDKAVFEYTNHPCTPHATNPETPTPLYETDCVNGKDNKLRTDPGGTPSYDADNGTWIEPDTPSNLIHQNDATGAPGYKNDAIWGTEGPPNAIIYQCQDSESFCSVIEIETKVFRRIL